MSGTRWHSAVAMLVFVASAVWSALALGAPQDASRPETMRPAGWQASTHGDSAPPDYARLFGMDTVHELRIVIAPERFRAMQDDLQSLGPSIGAGMGLALGAGAAGGRVGGAGGLPGPAELKEIAAFAEGIATACTEKAADASCSVNGIEGRCTELGAGPRLCLPEGVGKIIAGLPARGAGPDVGLGFGLPPGLGAGGPLSMISRDPIYVPVDVQYDGRTWTHVGMRYKGNSSLMFAGVGGSGKIPFRLDFDRYEDEFPEIRNQRFHGFEKLTFSSNFGDDSQIRELFVTEAFRDRGVPAARAAFYRVFVDTGSGPEYWGLYTMIEDPADGAMFDAQFGGRGGNLYKPDGPGANWTQFAREGFPKKTNERQADFSDVEAAITALHAAPGPGSAAWRAALEARFDADLFLRWLAVSTALQNWDAYGTFAHNYYLYGDPGQQGRLRWIPWDHNFALGGAPFGFGGGGFGPGGGGNAPAAFPLPAMFGGGDDILHTQKGSQWPLISRLLADEVYAARYREHLARALEGLLAPDASAARMRQLHALIASSVAGDRGERPSHTTISSAGAFEQSIDGPGGLREVVERRHAAIRKALAARPR
jgi:hypothetical protein